jgi:hypothetical protein
MKNPNEKLSLRICLFFLLVVALALSSCATNRCGHKTQGDLEPMLMKENNSINKKSHL